METTSKKNRALLHPDEVFAQVRIHPEHLTAKTLAILDRSVGNLKDGVVSDPIDLSTLKDLNP